MPGPFFEIATPEDMLAKARRELDRFEQDYAEARGIDVGPMRANPDFELCRLVCNHGKHLELTGGTDAAATRRSYSVHQDAHYRDVEEFAVIADGQRIDVESLGRRVLKAWELALSRSGAV